MTNMVAGKNDLLITIIVPCDKEKPIQTRYQAFGEANKNAFDCVKRACDGLVDQLENMTKCPAFHNKT